MRNIFTIILGLCVQCSLLVSQSSVQGKLTNEQSEELVGATVVLLEPIDSTMTAFTITNDQGNFEIEDLQAGDYILQLSYISYANVSHTVNVGQGSNDLGEFVLVPSSEVLQQVTLKAEHIPMGILGDTINYNAAAFKTKPGASVEDLLKKLPGVEVNRDGSIKAQGEDVEKVLVDGKEFFGEDPKIATQNLEAEAVDKVQVFDKKSEMAEFTGIDDGQDEKTINLKLKDGYKSGGFGNISLAGGTESTYEGKLNYNRFNTNMQASILASANNINKQAFSFSEFIGFMGGLSNAMSATSGIFNFGEFGRSQTPKGIRDDLSGGLNFNMDFSKKLKLTSNYFYLDAEQQLNEINASTQFVDESLFNTQDSSDVIDRNVNHRLNAKITYKPNPTAELVFKNTLLAVKADNSVIRNTDFFSDAFTQTTRSNFILDENQYGYNGLLQFKKKFSKKGRNLINTLKLSIVDFDETNDVLNEYLQGTSRSLINQNQVYQNAQWESSFESRYTEPLGNKTYLGLNYKFNVNDEDPERRYFDIEGSLANLNDELSRAFTKTFTYHRSGLSLRKNTKRSKLNFGLQSQWTELNGGLVDEENAIDASYNHLLPSLSWSIDLNSSTSLEMAYSTELDLPSLDQLMPVIDNSNPNYIIQGNQFLLPEYEHSVSLGLNYFDNFNFTNLFFNTRLSMIKDRIVNSVSIDNDLIKTIQPMNTDNFLSGSAYFSFSKPFKPLGLKYRISTQSQFNRYESLLNERLNEVQEFNSYIGLTLENKKKDHLDIASGLRLDYSTRSYTQNEMFNQQFYNYALFMDAAFFLSESLTISSNFDYQTYSNEFFAEAENFYLWNASIKKTFQDNLFSIELQAFDLLGQNRGISRNGGINSLNESRFNTLERYFMAKVSYRLGKKKKKEGIQL